MNKRQRKKYEKKLKHKSYYGYREAKLAKIVNDFVKNNNITIDNDKINFIYIIDSRRRDLKHIHKIEFLQNCQPI